MFFKFFEMGGFVDFGILCVLFLFFDQLKFFQSWSFKVIFNIVFVWGFGGKIVFIFEIVLIFEKSVESDLFSSDFMIISDFIGIGFGDEVKMICKRKLVECDEGIDGFDGDDVVKE